LLPDGLAQHSGGDELGLELNAFGAMARQVLDGFDVESTQWLDEEGRVLLAVFVRRVAEGREVADALEKRSLPDSVVA
jgi:hypothetical protein